MKFRIKKKCGNHVHTDGKTYGPGDVIESPDDLTLRFKGKFEKVYTEQEEAEASAKPPIPEPDEEVDGALDEIDDDDLDEDDDEEDEEDDDEENDDEDDEEASEHGDDVTDEFPIARKVNVKIYKKISWYTIVDANDGEVLNEKKLRKAAVKPFIKKNLVNEE